MAEHSTIISRRNFTGKIAALFPAAGLAGAGMLAAPISAASEPASSFAAAFAKVAAADERYGWAAIEFDKLDGEYRKARLPLPREMYCRSADPLCVLHDTDYGHPTIVSKTRVYAPAAVDKWREIASGDRSTDPVTVARAQQLVDAYDVWAAHNLALFSSTGASAAYDQRLRADAEFRAAAEELKAIPARSLADLARKAKYAIDLEDEDYASDVLGELIAFAKIGDAAVDGRT